MHPAGVHRPVTDIQHDFSPRSEIWIWLRGTVHSARRDLCYNTDGILPKTSIRTPDSEKRDVDAAIWCTGAVESLESPLSIISSPDLNLLLRGTPMEALGS
jgi:hypothetical protein